MGRQWPPSSAHRVIPKPRRRTSGYPVDSDADLVEGLVEACGKTRRYVGESKRWMIFTGTHWEEDTAARIIEDIKAVCREVADEASTVRNARNLLSAARIAGIERLARSHPAFRIGADQWDRNPLVLNTPKGTIDLRKGLSRPHDATDYITKIAATSLSLEDHTIWSKVLERALPDGNDRAYLQRFLGYCLTGDTSEHALLIAHGTGANSKSVIFNTIREIVGDYATASAAETFLASKFDRHPAELAMLRGVRLVLVSEIDEGRMWNMMLINRITGGDPLIARVMRGDPFELLPEFKLAFLTNNIPSLRGVNEAARRRFNVLNFGITIPKSEQDPELRNKLHAEWPAIMRWLIAGAVHYFEKRGLHPPQSVKLSTTDYLDTENEVADWLRECTKPVPNAWTSSAELFASWSIWAKSAGTHVGSQKRLASKLRDMDYEPAHNPD